MMELTIKQHTNQGTLKIMSIDVPRELELEIFDLDEERFKGRISRKQFNLKVLGMVLRSVQE